jgi:RHS repeat-associated protein
MPEAITLPGGIRRENTYTPLMQPKSMTVKELTQNPLMTYDYEYSPLGNVRRKNTEYGNYAYQYDELYRLSGGTNPAASNESYTYDSVGNRLTSADAQGTWSYNSNNEVLGYRDVSYEYDLNGNVIRKTDQSGTTNYAYDADNRLIQIRDAQSAIYTYYYDPFGKRLWKDVNGVRTYFFYSDEGLIEEYDRNGNELRGYGYEPNSTWSANLLFQRKGTSYYWYQNDHLGTPQKILTTDGRVIWAAIYDSYGKAVLQVSEIENNLRFPGQYYDQETGLHYNYQRYYDPKTGRYLTPDPIGLGADINLFVYAANNPINEVDPSGLFAYHYLISYEAFNHEKCDRLGWSSASIADWVDLMFWEGSQKPENAFVHAMRNGRTGESVESARMKTDNYINEQMSRCNSAGLGRALHAEQDKWAGGHRGYQPWYGKLTFEHWWKDATGGGEDEAVLASVRLIKKFKELCPCVCGK